MSVDGRLSLRHNLSGYPPLHDDTRVPTIGLPPSNACAHFRIGRTFSAAASPSKSFPTTAVFFPKSEPALIGFAQPFFSFRTMCLFHVPRKAAACVHSEIVFLRSSPSSFWAPPGPPIFLFPIPEKIGSTSPMTSPDPNRKLRGFFLRYDCSVGFFRVFPELGSAFLNALLRSSQTLSLFF